MYDVGMARGGKSQKVVSKSPEEVYQNQHLDRSHRRIWLPACRTGTGDSECVAGSHELEKALYALLKEVHVELGATYGERSHNLRQLSEDSHEVSAHINRPLLISESARDEFDAPRLLKIVAQSLN
jgi:hypothetical protein